MTNTTADAHERRKTPSENMSFNLLDEPWIRVRLVNDSLESMSLREVFQRMREISALNGDSPTQDTAIFRLLMAIVVRALSVAVEFDPNTRHEKLWQQIADSDDLGQIIDEYLVACRSRFNLLDPAAPFYQVAELETKRGEHSDASVLIPDVGPGLFSRRTHDDAQTLDAASAARWLIWVQAYDLSGIKSGALGDSRVKGGKGYPIGTGWAGAIGSIHLTGPTLGDCILLNLPVEAVIVGEFEIDLDLPPWEREPDTAAPRGPEEVQPNGVVDLLTWQQRRVRLFATPEGRVDGVLICNGDKLGRANRFEEPYTAQRYSKDQSKKAGHDIRFARQLDPTLTVWRGIQSIFAESGSSAPGGAERKNVPDKTAPVLEQLRTTIGDIAEEKYGESQLSLSLTGISYGTQDAVIETEMYETLPVTLRMLTANGRQLRHVAISAVERVMTLRGQLRWFFRQLLVRAGSSPDDYPEQQVAAWLDILQEEYRHWLSALGSNLDAAQGDLEWRKTLWRVTSRAVENGVRQAGPRAAIGRMEENESGTVFHSAARYEAWMMKQLATATGATFTAHVQDTKGGPLAKEQNDGRN